MLCRRAWWAGCRPPFGPPPQDVMSNRSESGSRRGCAEAIGGEQGRGGRRPTPALGRSSRGLTFDVLRLRLRGLPFYLDAPWPQNLRYFARELDRISRPSIRLAPVTFT